MLSNQILHKTAQDIREITGFDCAIWDMQGLCLVRTNENLTEYELQIQDFRDDEGKCRWHGTGGAHGSKPA